MAAFSLAPLLLVIAALQTASASRPIEHAAIHGIRSAQLPPNFPDAYEMEYTFSMPYYMLLQPLGMSYPVKVWVDHSQEAVRVDLRGGIDKTIYAEGWENVVTPQKDKLGCLRYKNAGVGPVKAGTGGKAKMLRMPTGAPVLPDLSEWQAYGPVTTTDGKPAHMWQRKDMAGEKVFTYTFYVGEDGTPLQLQSIGKDLFKGSHMDQYIYDFTSFKPGPVDPEVFAVPKLCLNETVVGEKHPTAAAAEALLPGSHHALKDEAHYHGWSQQLGRTHSSWTEYASRLSAFVANKAKVLAHNLAVAAGGADAPTHTLKLNHFADWDRAEFDRVMLPRKWARDQGLPVEEKARGTPLEVFTPTMREEELPPALDWRATPADFAVKDQGQCGSCWAFGAAGAMEGAWFTSTGEARSFSEQQLIDCAWPFKPKGCNGGDYQPGFMYVASAGGIATTQDYPYVGNNDWCRDNTTTKAGFFKGFGQVTWQKKHHTMEALMRYGPLAIGIDATYDEFLFYSEGVYKDKRCSLKPAELDHAVLLVGWGTSPEGEDYWIVKNSWSKFWGDDGYIKVHRHGNDCGVASDVAFALVADEYVVPGKAKEVVAVALAKATSGMK